MTTTIEQPSSSKNYLCYNGTSQEAADVWEDRLSEVFGVTIGAIYKDVFVRHCIPVDKPEPLTAQDFLEMGIPIGHRKEITKLMTQIRSAKIEDASIKQSMASIEPKHFKLHTDLSGLKMSNYKLATGLTWMDYEGSCHDMDQFMLVVQDLLMSRGTGDELPEHFLRGFRDNQPMPFFTEGTTASGLPCSIILLRLPSVELVQDTITLTSNTIATMTNRFVMMYRPTGAHHGVLITYHKDDTAFSPWLHQTKMKWDEFSDCSREELVLHLATEALLTSRSVLDCYREQMGTLIEVPISKKATQVAEGMSLINRQAQVMRRCLCANKIAVNELSLTLETNAGLSLQSISELVTMAEEIESNAMDNLTLRMGLVGFRAQENMRLFTFISAVSAPMAVMTGWYGMNFQNMPELKEPNAYFCFSAVAGTVFVSMIWLISWRHREAPKKENIVLKPKEGFQIEEPSLTYTVSNVQRQRRRSRSQDSEAVRPNSQDGQTRKTSRRGSSDQVHRMQLLANATRKSS